jgi:hypothetical protein
MLTFSSAPMPCAGMQGSLWLANGRASFCKWLGFSRRSRNGSCQGAQHSSRRCYRCLAHAGGIANRNFPCLPCSLIDHLQCIARSCCGVRQVSNLSWKHCCQLTLAVGLTGQVSLSKVLFREQGTLRTPSLATVTPCARPTGMVRLHALHESLCAACRLYAHTGTLQKDFTICKKS